MTAIRSLPTGLLRFAGILAYHLGLANFVIGLRRRAPRILAYHACEPNETAFTRGLECNTPPVLFAKHLEFLVTHYEVVPFAMIASCSPGRAIAITFDDAYRSVYRHAFPLLRQYRCTASVFVVTDALDNNAFVWVNELTWLLNTRGEPARRTAAMLLGASVDSSVALLVERARALSSRKQLEDLLEAVTLAAGVRPPSDSSDLYLNWSDAAEMSKAGITFGNHTATHSDLARLELLEQHQEIIRAQRSLERHLPADALLSALAYPFGAHNASTRDAVSMSGIEVAVGIGGATEWTAPLQLARTPVGSSSVARLFADLEFVEPAKAFLRRIFVSLRRAPAREQWHSVSAERHVPGAPQV